MVKSFIVYSIFIIFANFYSFDQPSRNIAPSIHFVRSGWQMTKKAHQNSIFYYTIVTNNRVQNRRPSETQMRENEEQQK